MPKTKASLIIRAADKARRAERNVSEAQHMLKKALRARERAEAHYLQLVAESFAETRPPLEPAATSA